MKFMADPFLKATGAKVLREGTKDPCQGVSTDSRTVKQGELFFALQGPNFDGHDFVEGVFEKKAWGVVVEKNPKSKIQNPKPFWVFEVKDTLKALGDVAKWWRRQFHVPFVAITGSNGKTTTKEMTASILKTKWSVLKTEGNFNNLIGLPLTLNRLDSHCQACILEMGMNAAGEIKRLTEIADPTLGLVTHVAPAHLERLHTVEAVAFAKNELYETMSQKGVAVYNAEDPWMKRLIQKFKGKKISFGMQRDCDISFEHMEMIGFDSMELKLSVQGKQLKTQIKTMGIHNVMNAMAACGAALGLNFSIESMAQGLENFLPMKMRYEQVQLKNGARLVNDAYNANPLSMEMAFQTTGRFKRAGKFLAILGDMKELGEKAPSLHEETGKKAVQCGVEKLFLIGEFAPLLAKGARKAGLDSKAIWIAKTEEELIAAVEKEMKAGDVVLVKASRAMQLERVVEELKERFGI